MHPGLPPLSQTSDPYKNPSPQTAELLQIPLTEVKPESHLQLVHPAVESHYYPASKTLFPHPAHDPEDDGEDPSGHTHAPAEFSIKGDGHKHLPPLYILLFGQMQLLPAATNGGAQLQTAPFLTNGKGHEHTPLENI